MFDNYPSQPNNNGQVAVSNGSPSLNQVQPVDMYAGIAGPNSGRPSPQSTTQIYGPQQFSSMPGANVGQSNESPGSFKFLIIGIVTLLLVLGSAIVVYQTVLKPKFQGETQTSDPEKMGDDSFITPSEVAGATDPSVIADTNSSSSLANETEVVNDTEIIPSPSNLPDANQTAIETEVPVTPIPKLDTDNDGLFDDAESLAGTNPTLADSDGDGLDDGLELNKHKTDPLTQDTDKDALLDGEEINSYQTDPLTKDTDGDGYSDGQEVKNGYNPNGSGRYTVNKK